MPSDPDQDPEVDLMARIGAGDTAAFETLYDRYAPAVMRFIHGLCQDRAAAEDLVQETFAAAWRAAPRWRPTGKVRTWLFQIAKRQSWRHGSRRRARRRGEVAVAAGRPRQVRDRPEVEVAEEAARLRQALLELSARRRLVFVLVRLLGLSYAETARVTGLRPGTVKSRMAAAEAELRRRLAPP